MKKTIASIVTALAVLMMMVSALTAFAADSDSTSNAKDLADGTYAVDYEISSDTGVQKLILPAKLVVSDGELYAQLVFNDVEVDKLYLGDETILPVSETKTGYTNDIGTYQVFNLPIEDTGAATEFTLHTRGNNLVTDQYVITLADYDEDFDADAQAEEVLKDNLGATEYRFYKWNVGMSFSVWGPFVFLGICVAATLIVIKKFTAARQ